MTIAGRQDGGKQEQAGVEAVYQRPTGQGEWERHNGSKPLEDFLTQGLTRAPPADARALMPTPLPDIAAETPHVGVGPRTAIP